jgi:hypothetical protein
VLFRSPADSESTTSERPASVHSSRVGLAAATSVGLCLVATIVLSARPSLALGLMERL